MWKTLALLAALVAAPAEACALTLTNAHTTYGVLGAPRASDKFLPGDTFLLSFDIEGAKANDNGEVVYTIAMEVRDGKDKVKFRQTPREVKANTSLGGGSLPGYALIQIGVDQPPGKYTVKVQVTDKANGASQALTRAVEILPANFGLVRLTTTADANGQAPVSVLGKGQSLWINFAAVGFGRDKSSGQPNLNVSLRVLDEEGKPTLAKAFTGTVTKGIPKKSLAVPMQFALHLNRAGKFTVELKATDQVTDKTATLSFPITVLQPK
jgi:hypothetical protein